MSGRRRWLQRLLALGIGASVTHAAAQSKRPARIAILDDATEAIRASLWASFRRRLSELGYKEGSDFRVEATYAGAARARIPAVYARRDYPESGGLLSYGSDTEAVFIRSAEYVDRILRGASPADLPFEIAATFRLTLNLKTARALGLAVPDAVRLRADEIIQ